MNGPTKEKARRALVAGLGSLAGLTVLVGALHTKPARPLVVYVGRSLGLTSAAGCPLGYDKKASPEERTRALTAFANDHRGEAFAPARPALGFALGESTREDVGAWAKANGASCDAKNRSGHDLECNNVRSQEIVWLDFDASGKLVSVIGTRRDADASAASHAYASVQSDIAAEAGPPTRVTEDGSAEKLASAALYQATTEYRYKNYFAVVRATNVGGGSYLLTEEYRALAD